MKTPKKRAWGIHSLDAHHVLPCHQPAQYHQKPSGEQGLSRGPCAISSVPRADEFEPAPPQRTTFLLQLTVLRRATLHCWMQTRYRNCFSRSSPNQLQKGKAHLGNWIKSLQGFWMKSITCVHTHMDNIVLWQKYKRIERRIQPFFSRMTQAYLKTSTHNVHWGFEQHDLEGDVPTYSRGLGMRWSYGSLPTQTIL